jgi:hypothetical protein
MAAAKLYWTQLLRKLARRGLRGVKGDWDLPATRLCGLRL